MPLIKTVRKVRNVLAHSGWNGILYSAGRRLFPNVFRSPYIHDAMIFASWMDFSNEDALASRQVHAGYPGELPIRSLTWFLPEFQNPFYGGVYTLLRFADYFKRTHGVENRFLILGNVVPEEIRPRLAQAFPSLADAPLAAINLTSDLAGLPTTDAAIATLWGTAYFMLKFNQTRRKFYFMQDYEPLFYPAGSTFGQVEASYRLGFYGIANTPTIKQIYEQQYGGQAEYFLPCVDTRTFHPTAPTPGPANAADPAGPLTVFFYGRPDHARNGFELGAQALRKLKKKMGDRVRIVAAGDAWQPEHYALKGVVENLGLLSLQQTAELYRTCAAGLVMMFTRHPSYLPFELMASGALVVTNFNPATTWFLKDGENCLLTEASATCIAETLEQGLTDHALRHRITAQAACQIQESYANWDREIEKIYRYMCSPK